MMPDTVRAFLAVPVPETVTAFIREVQARLGGARLNIRWVPARNVHLTLKFLGDIDPLRIPDIVTRMDAATGATPALSLAARGVGVFPSLKQARVVWVGLTGDVDRLQQLQAALESALEAAGFERERRDYRAHLTIGRTRQRLPAQAIDAMLAPLRHSASDPFTVDHVGLYRSILKPAGAEYHRLHLSALGGDPGPPRQAIGSTIRRLDF